MNAITPWVHEKYSNKFECTGKAYRLPDGKNMANTLVHKHYIFKVHTTQVIDENGGTILPPLQVELALTEKQKG